MRIHVAAAVYVLLLARFFRLDETKLAILLGTIALVMICEMFNTALEALTDLSSPSYSSLARAAKDIAAGAVLCAAGLAVVIGFLLFGDPVKLMELWEYLTVLPVRLLLLLGSVVPAALFIFCGLPKRRNTRLNPQNKGEH